MKITEKLKDKKILIWGYGREGKSTENFINSFCDVKSVTVFEGAQEDINESEYDYIIKSPGISVERIGSNYTSQTALFLEEFASQTIGVTGTKGKSTVSSLTYHALKECTSHNILLVGNLGFPCLDYYDSIDDDTVIVFEMSCHQLSDLKISPHIGIFLNLFEEHLDYYGTFERYARAKMNIALHQNVDDYFFYGENVPEIDTKAKKTVVVYDPEQRFEMKLLGEHNQFNAQMVYKVCSLLFGCEDKALRAAFASFTGLAHRLEYVANVAGVDYYDDSISTIPEATILALESVPNAKTVIIGGMDRNIDYDILVRYVRDHAQYFYIFSYESGRRIYNEVSDLDYCFYMEDLAGAVRMAKEITPEGQACVLSPAAASYGYFKNFEERGDAFKKLVKG